VDLDLATMKTLRMGAPVHVGDLELIPIEATSIQAQAIGGAVTGFASKEITALVIRSGTGQRALSPEGREIPIEELAREVPDLREL
jgi:hypothetical protein